MYDSSNYASLIEKGLRKKSLDRKYTDSSDLVESERERRARLRRIRLKMGRPDKPRRAPSSQWEGDPNG